VNRGASLFLLCVCALALAEEPPHCADIADAAARLACYDAQAKPAQPSTAAAPAPVEEPGDIASVDARIVGTFKGWHKGTLFKLDNGQTWKVDDGAEQYYADLPDNPKFAIARGCGHCPACALRRRGFEAFREAFQETSARAARTSGRAAGPRPRGGPSRNRAAPPRSRR